MFASPFFTPAAPPFFRRLRAPTRSTRPTRSHRRRSGRRSPSGRWRRGVSAAKLGYSAAFVLNALSFVFSAWAIAGWCRRPEDFRAASGTLTEAGRARPWHEYIEGLRYMRQQPLILAIALLGIGWASGGGAAQILFSLFGEMVFNRGPAGIGIIWGCAGLGSHRGGIVAHAVGPRLSFLRYKQLVAICYLVHGGAYVVFSQMPTFGWALVFIGVSRAAVAISSVLNMSILLPQRRGRVPGTRLLDERIAHLGDDDAVDAGGGACVHARQPQDDRGVVGRAQLADSALLDLGGSRGAAPGARRPQPRRRGSRSATGASSLICRL